MTRVFTRTSRLIAASAVLFWCCDVAANGWRERQAKWWTVSDVAYDALIALEPARRDAEAKGDGSAVDRIAPAAEGLLLLFDDQNSEAALRKLVALAHFDFGAAASEIYECLVIRKGSAIAAIVEEDLRAGSDPCSAAYGPGSFLCPPDEQSSKRLRLLLSKIKADEPCTIVR